MVAGFPGSSRVLGMVFRFILSAGPPNRYYLAGFRVQCSAFRFTGFTVLNPATAYLPGVV